MDQKVILDKSGQKMMIYTGTNYVDIFSDIYTITDTDVNPGSWPLVSFSSNGKVFL